jgi:hypothetical protein
LALEISTPEVVGNEYRVRGFAGMPNPTAALGARDQAVAMEDIADGGTARELPIGMTTVNDFEDLFGAPKGVLSPKIEQRFGNVRVGLIGEVKRFSGLVFKGSRSVFLAALNPFVSGLAGDIVTIAKLRERKPLL